MASNKKTRQGKEVNASSTADIAFLLLIFFLVTTTIDAEKGITLLLPSNIEVEPVPVNDRNIFKVQLNSQDNLLVNGELLDDANKIKPMLKEFILNNGKRQDLSVSPKDAVVSFKTNRGTSYKAYINVLDELKGAYYEIYAERAGITPEQFRSLDERKPKDKSLLNQGKEGIPMNISIAEPSK